MAIAGAQTAAAATGTAQREGELWGAKAEDWAALQEPAWTPVFEAALELAGIRHGDRLLDIGCGAGGALRLARQRGAVVSGLDGSANLVRIARRRLSGARIAIGDMEALPFADARFDIVTAINAFQFAGNLAQALTEARRVCRPDGTLFILSWGRAEECELVRIAMRPVMAQLPRAASTGTPAAWIADEAIAGPALRDAGLVAERAGDFFAALAFADGETALRALLSAGVMVAAARRLGEARLSEIIRAALPAVTRADGTVVFSNRFYWLRAKRVTSG